MTEPTIICPNCKMETKLTESLAAPLIESARGQYEQQLAQKDSGIAKREQTMRETENQIAEAKLCAAADVLRNNMDAAESELSNA